MMGKRLSCYIQCERVPYIEEAVRHANEFLITAAAQKNRNHLEGHVDYGMSSFATQEIFLDPQTSGGLLFAVHPEDAEVLLAKLQERDIVSAIVGEITEKKEKEIYLV